MTNRRRTILILLVTALMALAALSAAAGDVRLRGKVLEADGSPAASVWVVARRGDQVAGRFLTGDDGRFSISGLAEGTYTVTVERGDKELYRRDVRLPQDDYVIRL